MDLTITLSIRNLDRTNPITLKSLDYFDNDGNKKKPLLKEPKVLGPYGSANFLIRREEFRGDVGANAILTWESQAPVTPPLAESIMVGLAGTQAWSFVSRGVVTD